MSSRGPAGSKLFTRSAASCTMRSRSSDMARVPGGGGARGTCKGPLMTASRDGPLPAPVGRDVHPVATGPRVAVATDPAARAVDEDQFAIGRVAPAQPTDLPGRRELGRGQGELAEEHQAER